MSTQLFVALLAVFVLGLFVGTNLGVILMCVLRFSAPDSSSDGEMAALSVQVEDRL